MMMIMMQTKKMKQRLMTLRVASLLGLSLFLGSCRDDLQDLPGAAQEQTSDLRPTSDYIGQVNLAIEADVVPVADPEGRASISFKEVNRTDKISQDGNTPSTGANYTSEVAPRMNFKVGDKVTGYLIFLLDDGTTQSPVFREQVSFEVIEGTTAADGTYNINAKNRVRFVGNVSFPTAYNLQKEFALSTTDVTMAKYPTKQIRQSRWKVMAMFGEAQRTQNPNWSRLEDVAGGNRLLFGHYESNYMFTSDGNPSNDFTYGNATGSMQVNVPCISDWKTLNILRDNASTPADKYTAANFDLKFRPEGVILQYDLWSLAYDIQDIRRVGLISNVLDFQGYYELNAAQIREGYNAKDGNDYGAPAWVPLAPSSGGFTMNYTPANEAALSSGARVFPWDMPTLSSNEHSNYNNWGGSGNSWSIDNPSVSNVYFRGNTGTRAQAWGQVRAISDYPWLSQTKKLWTFLPMGGTTNGDRVVLYFWGMPRTGSRKVAAGREATYFYASAYSLSNNGEVFDSNGSNIDTYEYSRLETAAIDRTREMNSYLPHDNYNYERFKKLFEENPTYNTYNSRFPGGLFPAYRQATALISQEVRKANQDYVQVPSQPLLILHQTTNPIATERRIYHAQVVLKPDLLFTEVDYLEQNGQNYSMLEISNPTAEPVDLSLYGVVRLIPSASNDYLAFRSSSGQPVDQLSQALILPLTALKNGSNDTPFATSALSGMAPSNYSYAQAGATQRGHNIMGRPGMSGATWPATALGPQFTNSRGFKTQILNDPDYAERPFYVLPGQTIVLGASGHVNAPAVTIEGSWVIPSLKDSWFSIYYDQLRTQFQQSYLRYAIAYADGPANGTTYGEGTLDYKPGHAFALVKKTSTGWQIIDATGPVGRQQLAFAGTYAAFKAEFDQYASSTAFAASRDGGVSYPFIAPFRTQRLRPSQWSDDWTVSSLDTGFTPGRRFQDGRTDHTVRTTRGYFKRTPLDETFTTYQNARPTRGY